MSTFAVHELTAAEAREICERLHAEHIDVTVSIVDHVAHVCPVGPMSLLDEITALRAVRSRTNAFVWDGPR